MGLREWLFGSGEKAEAEDSASAKLDSKLDEVLEQLKRIEVAQRDGSYTMVKELRDLRAQEVGSREEVLKRIEGVQEKLQFAVEEYVATDEDVKQMVRESLKTRAKTFNEIQKETKISPQTLQKYLRQMKSEVEEFNGVYRIIFSSSLVYVGNRPGKARSREEDDAHLLELIEADAVYGAPGFDGP
jgi:small-conductance mechanosensitive channel